MWYNWDIDKIMSKTDRTSIFTYTEKKSIYSLSGVLFFRMFSIFILLPVFSILALDLEEATPFLIGVAFGAYGLTQGLLQLPFGIWSDKVGRKKVIVIGLVTSGGFCQSSCIYEPLKL